MICQFTLTVPPTTTEHSFAFLVLCCLLARIKNQERRQHYTFRLRKKKHACKHKCNSNEARWVKRLARGHSHSDWAGVGFKPLALRLLVYHWATAPKSRVCEWSSSTDEVKADRVKSVSCESRDKTLKVISEIWNEFLMVNLWGDVWIKMMWFCLLFSDAARWKYGRGVTRCQNGEFTEIKPRFYEISN